MALKPNVQVLGLCILILLSLESINVNYVLHSPFDFVLQWRWNNITKYSRRISLNEANLSGIRGSFGYFSGSNIQNNPNLVPKVFVLPIGSQYHSDLLRSTCDISRKPWIQNGTTINRIGHVRKPFHVLYGFTKTDLNTLSVQRPFGDMITSKSCPNRMKGQKCQDHLIEVTRGDRFSSEYDQDVHFHRMVSGWHHRVDNIKDADLVYIPIYFRWRLYCSGRFTDEASYDSMVARLSRIIAKYLSFYEDKIFFIVNGGICSCPDDQYVCNPLWKTNPKLRQKLRVVAWEKHSGDKNGVVFPYMSLVHEIYFEDYLEKREKLVLFIGNTRTKKCTSCGPCSNTKTCEIGCFNIRGILISQLKEFSNSTLVVHEPSPRSSEKDHRKTIRLMLTSTFCLQPTGDSITRKSFYEAIILGCIPVVFRDDMLYKEQFAFSNHIPYSELWYVIPEEDVLKGHNVVQILSEVKPYVIKQKRDALAKYRRLLTFSHSNSTLDGYNAIFSPDTLYMTLQEVWATGRSSSNNNSHLP